LELTINYGFKPNAEMLFHYGFVCLEPSHDTVGLPLPILKETDPLLELKQMLLEKLGHDSPVFRVCVPSCLSPSKLAVVASSTDLDVLRVCLCDLPGFLEPAATACDEEGPLCIGFLDPDVEAAVLQFVRDSVHHALTTLHLGSSASRNHHVEVVERYVNVQRTVLAQVAKFLTESRIE